MRIFTFLFCSLLALPAFGQGVGINSTGDDPDPSAVLDVSSTEQGVLLPRMSTAQRQAIADPATGLIVFDNDTESFWYRDSTTWINLVASGADSPVRLDNESLIAGDSTALNLTTGNRNVLLGFRAGQNIDQTNGTIAVGFNAFRDLSGSGNTFNVGIGWNTAPLTEFAFPFFSGTSELPASGFGNTLVGSRIFENNLSGTLNVGIGYQAMQLNVSGSDNTAVGSFALNKNNAGVKNVAVGFRTLQENADGAGNVAVGFDAGLRGANNQNATYLGRLAQNDSLNNSYNNVTAVGYQATVSADNQVRLGNLAVTDLGGFQSWSVAADSSFSTNVAENVPGLDLIRGLRPVSFQLDRETLAGQLGQVYEAGDLPVAPETGFFGQEVETTLNGLGYDFNGLLLPATANGEYRLAYARFVVPLTRAVQELDDIIANQNAQINDLTQLVQQLQTQMQEFISNQQD